MQSAEKSEFAVSSGRASRTAIGSGVGAATGIRCCQSSPRRLPCPPRSPFRITEAVGEFLNCRTRRPLCGSLSSAWNPGVEFCCSGCGNLPNVRESKLTPCEIPRRERAQRSGTGKTERAVRQEGLPPANRHLQGGREACAKVSDRKWSRRRRLAQSARATIFEKRADGRGEHSCCPANPFPLAVR